MAERAEDVNGNIDVPDKKEREMIENKTEGRTGGEKWRKQWMR